MEKPALQTVITVTYHYGTASYVAVSGHVCVLSTRRARSTQRVMIANGAPGPDEARLVHKKAEV